MQFLQLLLKHGTHCLSDFGDMEILGFFSYINPSHHVPFRLY